MVQNEQRLTKTSCLTTLNGRPMPVALASGDFNWNPCQCEAQQAYPPSELAQCDLYIWSKSDHAAELQPKRNNLCIFASLTLSSDLSRSQM